MSEQEIEQQNTVTDDNRMILRTENLVKKYGKRTVVSHVSFDVKQGEIVGLLGPNGAGKTTSFYMTTGLIVPNEGHIFLNDLDITSYPVYKRAQNGIGYLAQEASVFRKMSVEDNIASVLELTNTTPEYQKDKLESLIAEFRLQKVPAISFSCMPKPNLRVWRGGSSTSPGRISDCRPPVSLSLRHNFRLSRITKSCFVSR